MKIEVSNELFLRLQKLAVPFIDTPESVIDRAVSLLESKEWRKPEPEIKVEKPKVDDTLHYRSYNDLPSLKHTRPYFIEVDGIHAEQRTWNGLNQWFHTRVTTLVGVEEMLSISTSNVIRGKKQDNGFDYVPKIGCSIQRSDASTTLKHICRLAEEFDLKVKIHFEWKNHDEALYPLKEAVFTLSPKSEGLAQ